MNDMNINFDSLLINNPTTAGIKQKASDAVLEQEKVKAAKDFESLLLHQLLSTMSETIEDSGLFDDAAGKQVNSMFYSFLADDMSSKGGMGLWKEIYNMMDSSTDEIGLLDTEI